MRAWDALAFTLQSIDSFIQTSDRRFLVLANRGINEYCPGQSWSLKVSGAQADTTMRLFGVSNAQVWEIAAWNRTDANGRYEESGTFSRGTESWHMLYVEIDGASSNDVSFRVSNCTPYGSSDELR